MSDRPSSPVAGATVIRDSLRRPAHLRDDPAAAMYAAGYVDGEDRLFLMDVLRRMAEGSEAGCSDQVRSALTARCWAVRPVACRADA